MMHARTTTRKGRQAVSADALRAVLQAKARNIAAAALRRRLAESFADYLA